MGIKIETNLFFNGWSPLIRIIIVGIFSYFSLIVLLRASGKRTLSHLNEYDLVISMALGSIMANVLVEKGISISESIVASAVLIFLQYSLTYVAFKVSFIKDIISAKPIILFHNGHYIEKNLKKERICKTEIKSALNLEGVDSIDDVKTIILESNGEICVIEKNKGASHTERQSKKE